MRDLTMNVDVSQITSKTRVTISSSKTVHGAVDIEFNGETLRIRPEALISELEVFVNFFKKS